MNSLTYTDWIVAECSFNWNMNDKINIEKNALNFESLVSPVEKKFFNGENWKLQNYFFMSIFSCLFMTMAFIKW